VLNAASRELTGAEVAVRSGLSRATAHRFLANLADLGYVHRDVERKTYSVGFPLTLFGNKRLVVSRIARRARRHLQVLSRQCGLTAYIGFLEGPQTIVEECVIPAHMLKVAHRRGAHFDAHAHSLGKALMALLPRQEISAIYETQTLRTHTSRTCDRLSRLLRMLDDVRRQGFAVDDGELTVGLRSVATALVNPKGRALCAIGVEGFKHELDWAKTQSLVSSLILAGGKIMRQVNESVERTALR
jgi:DNA-binding IclR family transcriptional regulator